MSDAWIGEEPRLGDLARHVVHRALRQPGRTLFVTVALAALLVAQRLNKQPSFVATAVMRITEGFTTGGTPRPPSSLLEYIYTIAMNQKRLVEIMKKYGLTGREPKQQMIDLFRESIDVKVNSNYFVSYDDSEGPRSATVVIEFAAGAREQAVGVVHDIAASVVIATEEARAARVEAAHGLYTEVLREARAQLEDLVGAEHRLDTQTGGDETARRVELAQMAILKDSLQQRVEALEKLAGDTEVAISVEESGIGMTFEIVNEEVDVFGAPLSPLRAAMLLCFYCVILLPICVVCVGAFDRKVHRRDDLNFLGMPVLGVLPRFAGDDLFSLADRDRRARKRRV